jgi:thioredoxin 1
MQGMSESNTDEIEAIRQKKIAALQEQMDGDATASKGAGTPTEPVHIHGGQELQEAVDTHAVALVDFHAEWCGPCKMLEPIVATLAAETPAAVLKVDIDENQQLAQQYQVRGVPTLLLFAGGQPVEQVVGVRDEHTLRSLIQQYT